MPEIVVTLDIGGSGVKASCFDPAGDVAPAAIAVRYPSADNQDDGTFNPDAWAETAIAALAAIVARCGAPSRHYLGVTISAIRIPFVLLDADQRVVGPSLLNRDRRALPIVDDLVASVGHRELHRITGHWAAPEFGLPKLLWIQRHCPEAWAEVRTIVQLHDWFIFRLCGAVASEASSAAMSQMMDIAAGTWAYDFLASVANVRAEMLPEFTAAGTRVGGLLDAVAHQVGLAAGLPVHVGGGDTHMSALAAGGPASGYPVVVAGTTGPAQLAVDSPATVSSWFPLLVSSLPGGTGWALESNAGPTGEIADRLLDLSALSGADLQAAAVARGFDVEDTASRSEPLTVLSGNPFFGPDGWRAWPTPTISGLTSRHTAAELLAAARTGTCLALSQVLNQLSAACEPATTVIATGGMSRNARWSQTFADAAGRCVLVRDLDHVSGLAGAALVADVSVESALQNIPATRYTPDPGRHSDLQRSTEAYCRLYAAAQRRSAQSPDSGNEVDVYASPH